MSSDMEKGPIIRESMPLQKIENPTLLVDVLERSDGRWSTWTLPLQALFDVSDLMEHVKYLKTNLNESQEHDQPEVLLM
jgi:hypothetical protein